MSMKATLQAAVNQAFKAVGDLVSLGTLSSTTATGYNFATGELETTYESTTVELIETSNTTALDSGNQPMLDFVIKDPGLDLSLYDKVTVNGEDYFIESFEQYKGVSILKVRRS